MYDASRLYAEQDLTGVSDPNMTVFGKIGQRKSTLIKCLLLRQLGLGRQVWVVDVKPLQGESPPGGEYSRLARSARRERQRDPARARGGREAQSAGVA